MKCNFPTDYDADCEKERPCAEHAAWWGKKERDALCEALPAPGTTGSDAYTTHVYYVVLSDGSTFPTNVRAVLAKAHELGLVAQIQDPRV